MTLNTRTKTRGGPTIDRFFQKVDVNGPIPVERPELGPCWIWTAFTHDGYGRFWFDGRNWPAHRWLYEDANGEIPSGYEPDHLCRNRACVNLGHIEVVTQAENVRRGAVYRKGLRYGNPLIQLSKTHCPRDHEYTEDNTRRYRGRRICRACARERYHRTKSGEQK